MPRYLFLFFSALLTALLVTACCSEDPFIPTRPDGEGPPDPKVSAFLRVVHASVDGPKVRVFLDTTEFFSQAQGYLQFPVGVNDARFYPADTNATIISFVSENGTEIASSSITLKKEKYYTAYFYGNDGDYDVLITEDSPKSTSTNVRYRIVHFSPDSPTIDVGLGDNSSSASIVASDLAYGNASPYIDQPAVSGTGLHVFQPDGKLLFSVPKPFISLPSGAVLTIVMTGFANPGGNDPFLFFSIFNEHFQAPVDSLYGNVPLNVRFGAVRFVNIVPTGSDSTLDVAFFDPAQQSKYANNDYFRRDVISAQIAVTRRRSLTPENDHTIQYFLLSTLLRNSYPYRIEIGNPSFNSWELRYQTPLVPPQHNTSLPFEVGSNARHTIVAYGPFAPGQAQSLVYRDNVPLPGPGSTGFRLFHGAFGQLGSQQLKIRVNGSESPLMSYGQAPGQADAFTTSAGATTIEVLDANNTLLHTQTLDEPLKGNISYTIFLSRGPNGDTLLATPLSDETNLLF